MRTHPEPGGGGTDDQPRLAGRCHSKELVCSHISITSSFPLAIGKPLQGLAARGHELVVFTVRGDHDRKRHVEEWLRYYDIPFARVTNVKESFDLIVDDRAVRFVTWDQTVREVEC